MSCLWIEQIEKFKGHQYGRMNEIFFSTKCRGKNNEEVIDASFHVFFFPLNVFACLLCLVFFGKVSISFSICIGKGNFSSVSQSVPSGVMVYVCHFMVCVYVCVQYFCFIFLGLLSVSSFPLSPHPASLPSPYLACYIGVPRGTDPSCAPPFPLVGVEE